MARPLRSEFLGAVYHTNGYYSNKLAGHLGVHEATISRVIDRLTKAE